MVFLYTSWYGISFFREGDLKVTSEMNLDNGLVLFISYFICAIITGSILIYKKAILKSIPLYHVTKCVALAGICSGSGLFLYSMALIDGPTSIVSVIFASRSIIIVIISALFLKEKLSRAQILAIVLLCSSLFLVKLSNITT